MLNFRSLAIFCLSTLVHAGALNAQDVVSADRLVREISSLVRFTAFESGGEVVPALLVNRTPPDSLYLSNLQRDLPYAVMWLLEGSASYDRAEAVRVHGRDTASMRLSMLPALEQDSTFVKPLLQLAFPLLEAKGVVVLAAPDERAFVSEADLYALAARYIQLADGGEQLSLTVCAKPAQMRDRPVARNDVLEAWLYSAVRTGVERGGLMEIVSDVFSGLPREADGLEARLWASMAADERFQALIAAHVERTSAWMPVSVGP